MRAPIRSHGFDKPSDLEDELSQLDDDVKATASKPAARAKPPEKSKLDASLRKEVDDLRRQVDSIRKQVEKLQAARANASQSGSSQTSHSADISTWLPIVRSVAITSLAGRIFSSSPIMALLVAAVPFALGLSAGSK
jgi:septal ring factor EnvC (AmiA/AmiB activator)